MKRIFKIYTLILSLSLANAAQAQEVLHQEVENPDEDKYGPNELIFNHFSWKVGGGAPILAGESNEFSSMWKVALASRTKLKLSGLLSLGADISLISNFIKIDENRYTSLNRYFNDSSVTEESEGLSNYAIGAGIFARFNIDPKRGNYLGYYLDLGVDPSFAVIEKYTQHTEMGNVKKKIRYTPLPFANNFQYSAFARVAYNMIAIGAEYRLSDYFPRANIPEPPRLLFFLELNPYSL